ncbi:hypothetical protein IH979_02135 [Patescibacteria group bacterium]|nr:hypothetical protein [Patescibacteria group bacterium]
MGIRKFVSSGGTDWSEYYTDKCVGENRKFLFWKGDDVSDATLLVWTDTMFVSHKGVAKWFSKNLDLSLTELMPDAAGTVYPFSRKVDEWYSSSLNLETPEDFRPVVNEALGFTQ